MKSWIRIFFAFTVYISDNELDNFLNILLKTCKIINIRHNEFCIFITFKSYLCDNQYTVEAWNANKYYAWLYSGRIKGNDTDKLYDWVDKMPKRKTMWKLRKRILKCAKERNYTDLYKDFK